MAEYYDYHMIKINFFSISLFSHNQLKKETTELYWFGKTHIL